MWCRPHTQPKGWKGAARLRGHSLYHTPRSIAQTRSGSYTCRSLNSQINMVSRKRIRDKLGSSSQVGNPLGILRFRRLLRFMSMTNHHCSVFRNSPASLMHSLRKQRKAPCQSHSCAERYMCDQEETQYASATCTCPRTVCSVHPCRCADSASRLFGRSAQGYRYVCWAAGFIARCAAGYRTVRPSMLTVYAATDKSSSLVTKCRGRRSARASTAQRHRQNRNAQRRSRERARVSGTASDSAIPLTALFRQNVSAGKTHAGSYTGSGS